MKLPIATQGMSGGGTFRDVKEWDLPAHVGIEPARQEDRDYTIIHFDGMKLICTLSMEQVLNVRDNKARYPVE